MFQAWKTLRNWPRHLKSANKASYRESLHANPFSRVVVTDSDANEEINMIDSDEDEEIDVL